MIQLRPPPFFLSSIISEIRDKVKEKCVNKLETKRCSAELGVQLFFQSGQNGGHDAVGIGIRQRAVVCTGVRRKAALFEPEAMPLPR